MHVKVASHLKDDYRFPKAQTNPLTNMRSDCSKGQKAIQKNMSRLGSGVCMYAYVYDFQVYLTYQQPKVQLPFRFT